MKDFDGLVHLYILKDSQGNPLKEFKYNDETGKEYKLVAGNNETINVLDFRNLTQEPIVVWRVKFNSPGLQLTQENLINATVSQAGDEFTLSSVVANGRISVGQIG